MTKDRNPSIAESTAPAGEPTRADQTRATLIRAALRLFGTQGFDGTSTRDIAAAANANIGSIAYHFGGKEGLHEACARHIVETMQELARPVLTALPDAGSLQPDQAEALLRMALERMAGFVIGQPEAGAIVSFILRELDRPTAALDTVYTGVFEPVHRRFCEVWAAATGEDAESDATKIRVFTLIGQVVYFRIGREAVRRRMGWDRVGEAETAQVVEAAQANLAAILAASRGKRS